MSDDDRDPIIKGLHSLFNAMEQEKAELSSPQLEIEKYIRELIPLKRILIGMLTESTGVDILDSGGDSGRAWQQNRQIEDWDKTPAIDVEIWKGGDFMLTANVYHYLLETLSRDEEVEQLEKEFMEYAESNDDYWLTNMQEWMKSKGWDVSTTNTYNFDCSLSQVLQFTQSWDNDLILLQIHNGADVRGGYTKPRLFRVGDDFLMWNNFNVDCVKCEDGWYTDGGGYHWYPNNHTMSNEDIAELEISRDDCEESFCSHALHNGCGGTLQFSNAGGVYPHV